MFQYMENFDSKCRRVETLPGDIAKYIAFLKRFLRRSCDLSKNHYQFSLTSRHYDEKNCASVNINFDFDGKLKSIGAGAFHLNEKENISEAEKLVFDLLELEEKFLSTKKEIVDKLSDLYESEDIE